MVRFSVRSGDAAWSARRPGRPAGARLQAGARLTRRGARSFASSSTNFQDLAHLADVGASMSSGTDAALQEVLEELSVPARRAPVPSPGALLGAGAPARAACPFRGAAQGPASADLRHCSALKTVQCCIHGLPSSRRGAAARKSDRSVK